jgi:hypothetical protein
MICNGGKDTADGGAGTNDAATPDCETIKNVP